MTDFLSAHAIAGVEHVDEHGYCRTLRTENGFSIIRVRPLDGENALELRVRGAVPATLFQISSAARRVFDTSADPARTTIAFRSDPLLGPFVNRHPGLRIPGAWDPFECMVCEIVGQNFDITYGRLLVGRVVERVGERIEQSCGALTSLFPTSAALADADLDGLGLSRTRVATLKRIAGAVVGGELNFAASTECVRAALLKLGIGSSITEIVALRALGEPDAFPATNYDLRHIAGNPIRSLSAFELEARAEAWRPWRGYAAFHLWTATSNLLEHNLNIELRQPAVAKTHH